MSSPTASGCIGRPFFGNTKPVKLHTLLNQQAEHSGAHPSRSFLSGPNFVFLSRYSCHLSGSGGELASQCSPNHRNFATAAKLAHQCHISWSNSGLATDQSIAFTASAAVKKEKLAPIMSWIGDQISTPWNSHHLNPINTISPFSIKIHHGCNSHHFFPSHTVLRQQCQTQHGVGVAKRVCTT